MSQFEIIDRAGVAKEVLVEVVAYTTLRGSADVRTAENLHYANQSGMRLKMVRLRLQNSAVRVEPGAVYFMRGNLEMKASTGGGIVRGLARKMVSGENFFVNEIHGSGDIYLEPSFGHFLLHRVEANERGVVADRSLFYAGTAGLDISVARQKNVSAALFGGEGYFQTRISGSGVVVLYSPVPREEIIKVDLRGDKLAVDGNFALMRSEGISFRAEKSSKGWISTSVSGEGLLQTFSGHGSVWIAPTQIVYEQLSRADGLAALAQPPAARHSDTSS